jgi:hypothetical protein
MDDFPNYTQPKGAFLNQREAYEFTTWFIPLAFKKHPNKGEEIALLYQYILLENKPSPLLPIGVELLERFRQSPNYHTLMTRRASEIPFPS